MSATSVPCAEWGSSRYVRTESAFHIQSCLVTQKTGALTWHTVEVVPIQREPVPVSITVSSCWFHVWNEPPFPAAGTSAQFDVPLTLPLAL